MCAHGVKSHCGHSRHGQERGQVGALERWTLSCPLKTERKLESANLKKKIFCFKFANIMCLENFLALFAAIVTDKHTQ